MEPLPSHALFRCAQEIITNTVRHSGARNLWIRLLLVDGRYELHSRDDGHGAAQLVWGNGLTGMRERVEELGGSMQLSTRAGHGFSVKVGLPRKEAGMISVVYAEDQTIVRRGIVALLETTPDVRVIGEAVDGDQALAMIRKLHPDVALLDIRMPNRSQRGIEVLKELNKSGWAPHTIFLTTFDEDPLFLQAVQAGALGFFLKDVTVERLAPCHTRRLRQESRCCSRR